MSAPAPTAKWLVQNGRSVMVRNTCSEKASSSELLNLRLDLLTEENNGKSHVMFQSQILKETLNPTWTFNGMVPTQDAESYNNATTITFRVTSTDHTGKDIATILSEEVDLTRLVPLKQPVLNGQFAVPLNFLIINVEDQFHTTERLYSQFFGRTAKYTGEVFTLYADDDAETQNATAERDALVTMANARLKGLRKDLAGQLEKAEATRLQTLRQDKLSELEKLRAAAASASAELEQDRAAFEQEQRLFVESTQSLSRAVAASRDVQTQTRASAQVLNNKKLDLLKVKFLLEARKVKLLSELQTIYPIERLDSTGEYAIRGLELPTDLYSRDDEQVAAALGYTVHLLLLASKYLEIPLRYQLLFMGSRSFIRDPVVGSGTTLPLFRRNVEKDRFDRAALWLRRAVEQLLLARGVGYEPNQALLYNIQSLFQCEMCPKLAI